MGAERAWLGGMMMVEDGWVQVKMDVPNRERRTGSINKSHGTCSNGRGGRDAPEKLEHHVGIFPCRSGFVCDVCVWVESFGAD